MKFERRNNRNKLLKHPEMVVQDSLTVNWDVESFLQTNCTDDDLFQKLPAVLGGKLQKMSSVTF